MWVKSWETRLSRVSGTKHLIGVACVADGSGKLLFGSKKSLERTPSLRTIYRKDIAPIVLQADVVVLVGKVVHGVRFEVVVLHDGFIAESIGGDIDDDGGDGDIGSGVDSRELDVVFEVFVPAAENGSDSGI